MISGFRRRLAALAAGFVVCALAVQPASAAAPVGGGPPAAQPFIVGGEKVTVQAYPYAVYLVTESGFQFCGGVLVDHDSVLTAAHCASAVSAEELAVVAGRTDKRSQLGMRVGVSEVWIHPAFEQPWEGDDIAVLTLAHPVPYEPAEYADATDTELYDPGTMATVLGWGRIAEGGPRSHVLRAARVPVVSDTECGQVFDAYEPATMVCAGFEQGGVDACQGDSGGPLLVDGQVIGIVSWGRGCARPHTPGVYTRVSHYSELITKHIRESVTQAG